MGFQDIRVGVEVNIVDDSLAAVHGCQQEVAALLPGRSFCSSLRLVSLQFGQGLPDLPQL